MFLSNSDFSSVIKNTPLVSLDLCITNNKKLLLGKRINPPAKNYYFVPGGRILKSEKLNDAMNRILKFELGFSMHEKYKNSVTNIGVYEHFYENNYLDNSKFSTHYVVVAYLIPFKILKKNIQRN